MLERMDHIFGLTAEHAGRLEGLVQRLSGRYFTPRQIAEPLSQQLLSGMGNERWTQKSAVQRSLIDPFAGDGRLIISFLQAYVEAGLPQCRWKISAWDMDISGLRKLSERIRECGVSEFDLEVVEGDTFRQAVNRRAEFDVVITNPPWELLKPDVRELRVLTVAESLLYKRDLRAYDQFLQSAYPEAMPEVRFAGWGTNLSRVGLWASHVLAKPEARIGIVLPLSILGDHQSQRLRKDLLHSRSLQSIHVYPAEARLFEGVDAACASMAFGGESTKVMPHVTRFGKDLEVIEQGRVHLSQEFLLANSHSIPVSGGVRMPEVLKRIQATHRTLGEIEKTDASVWLGREVDETRIRERASTDADAFPFFRGRLIGRYSHLNSPDFAIAVENPPRSTQRQRIVWRDVARPSQSRRLIAAIIPPGTVAGNSLGVACLTKDSPALLRGLLAVMSSYVFEFQLRARLFTSHVSLAAVRHVRIPELAQLEASSRLQAAVGKVLSGDKVAEPLLEAVVAKELYGLARDDFEEILEMFNGVPTAERGSALSHYDALCSDPTSVLGIAS